MRRRRTYRTHGGVAALAVAAAALLAACGSSSTGSGTATSQTATTPTNSASVAAVAGNPPAAASGPGLGKPAVTIGDKNFTEEYILGSLYAQALAAKGYKVTVKGNIGSSEITYKALKSGQIDMYPEYTGTLLTAVAGITTPPKSAANAYTQAKAWAEQHGFTLLDKTPFSDSDALGSLKSYASQHHLTTIADLKPLGSSVKLGGAPEFCDARGRAGRAQEGLRDHPDVLAARDRAHVQGARHRAGAGLGRVHDRPAADDQQVQGADRPKFVFGFQNVAPIVSKKVVAAEGPEFAATLNKVSALLTIPAIQKMNAAVALDQQPYPQVAREFLQANGLL